MTKYKVGDVAALFSKPKSPTTAGGKKLQSLFEDYYSKKGEHDYHQQEENSEKNKYGEIQEMNDQSDVPKKSRKRKFSASNDTEFNNVSSKKFKETSEKEGINVKENKKQKKFKKKKGFQQKNNNDFKFNNGLFSKQHKESYNLENSKNNKSKIAEKQQDFPRKNKQSMNNSFNSSTVFPKFEAGNDSENDMESSSISKLNDGPKNSKQIKSFIKKSKKKSLDQKSSELSNNISCNDSGDSDDASLKKEIKDFIHSNSGKKKRGKSSDNEENSFNWYSQDIAEKSKTKFLMNENKKSEQNVKTKKKNKNHNQDQQDFPKTNRKSKVNSLVSYNAESMLTDDSIEQNAFSKKLNSSKRDDVVKSKKKFLMNENEESEQIVMTKKKNKNHNQDQQDFPRTNRKSKVNSFNSYNTESMLTGDSIEPNTFSKKLNSDVKKPKKAKHGFSVVNTNDFVAAENSYETAKPKGMTEFIRKPKNKNVDGTFSKDNFKKQNSEAFDSVDAGKNLKDEELNINSMRKTQMKGFESTAPDFIKLSTSDDNYEKNFEERLSRTLFVGNLPKNMSKQELRNLFSTFGAIETVRLTGVETDKAKIFGKNPPKLLNKNYASDTVPGFVVFREKEAAVEALKLSGSVFKGRHITVDFAIPAGTHKIYDNKRSIFVGNLPFNVQDESIWNAFSQCGRIEGVRVVRDRQTGLGKGFGYVLFRTVEAKQNALSLGSLSIEGRDIRIKAVDSNKKTQKSDSAPSTKRDTFKNRAIRMKKSKVTGGHKSIRKLTNQQKRFHKKKKTAEILQKAMK